LNDIDFFFSLAFALNFFCWTSPTHWFIPPSNLACFLSFWIYFLVERSFVSLSVRSDRPERFTATLPSKKLHNRFLILLILQPVALAIVHHFESLRVLIIGLPVSSPTTNPCTTVHVLGNMPILSCLVTRTKWQYIYSTFRRFIPVHMIRHLAPAPLLQSLSL